MAKKSSKAPRKKAADNAAEIEAILDDLKAEVEKGMSPKTFSSDTVETSLRELMTPKIDRRLKAGGKWADEKKNPLICAKHMGEIAKILAKGNTVDLSVADAARVAVKSDEHCKRTAAGGGDWCF